MGRRGRKRMSNKEKVVKTGDSSIKASPDFDTDDDLTAPEWLDDTATALWDEFAPQLKQGGVLTNVDRKSLELMCSAYSVILEADKQIKELGMVLHSDNGMSRQNPAYNIKSKASILYNQIAASFGLTPSSRQNVTLKVEVEEDEFDAFFDDQ